MFRLLTFSCCCVQNLGNRRTEPMKAIPRVEEENGEEKKDEEKHVVEQTGRLRCCVLFRLRVVSHFLRDSCKASEIR